MRLIFAGTPQPAVVALEKLLASEHEVVAVLSRPDAPRAKRGRTLYPSPVAALAQEHGIEVLKPPTLKVTDPKAQETYQRIKELSVDCIPVVAYGNLIPAQLLDVAQHGWVNLHFSLLPAWRGAAPVQAALAAGDTHTGATTFRIDEGLDTGDILGSITEPIAPTDTADDLLTRLAYQGATLLVDTMDKLAAGEIVPQPQQGQPTYAPKILSTHAQIDWTQPADVIERRIRAVTPAPGAWTMLSGQRMKIAPVTQLTNQATLSLEPGALAIEKNKVFVGTGTDPVLLSQIQAPGKKMMNASDWAHGLKDTEGLVFEYE
ncbi:methionyl-tRNA formyltransferase [Corynebacterium sp. sy039]|uniref:methionyl-tRNA formyltransferase n=1 Tax=Corynebacterium sp. sy039 TaxID=2599641 RepID=UPI0011B65557|nr:methionyl-tRNA formyltransferase [Corynebacterium sp. sy039]QDZ42663.1 methionyl-tRNA formyltransferase [Corynebacterium sp. sy039]